MKLNNTKKRSESSKKWLLRHMNDPYVKQAQKEGYRSRAAYKLLEIQKKFKILKPSLCVVDLGAAPGGWSQVASRVMKSSGQLIAIDYLPMDHIEHVHHLQTDFTQSIEKLTDLCPKGVDVILSDMAPPTCGISHVDHLRIISLLEEIMEFADTALRPHGHIVAKVFQGGTEHHLLKRMKEMFKKVVHFKPNASRKESSEIYLVALTKKY